MKKHYSVSPDGEKFQLPDPDDYAKEFDRLNHMVRDQRNQGRKPVGIYCPSKIRGWTRIEVKLRGSPLETDVTFNWEGISLDNMFRFD